MYFYLKKELPICDSLYIYIVNFKSKRNFCIILFHLLEIINKYKIIYNLNKFNSHYYSLFISYFYLLFEKTGLQI